MNVQQAILKCNKKAWMEIKQIQNANNMLEVEGAVNDALAKTFGMWNQGVYLIGMRRLGQMGGLEGERVIRIRRRNWDRHLSVIRHYLIDFIPERFFNTIMYRKFIGAFPVS